ncbi:polymorphic toxin-type HINT domain-containing protein [Streptomyces sp. D2-8]|uniref:polymorphic toxin-type HINT domain-containing protein n=1 Tax=Streptomyces sp. D2-8 TaxID=2707767 RepID=UPI0027E457DA|nr:polymorphic toxin-type HINT domain-containing protein [Streptomyces sp. D2-8]
MQLPSCALTTPEKDGCRDRTELTGANDPAEQKVTATVDLATASAAPTVLAATAAASGPGGSHEATSLSPSGSWMAGSSSGGFSWTYPIEAPEVPGGPQPEVELSYSSQSVDGRTASTNGQSSWIAEGWDYEPGFIERRYRSCSDDKAPIKDESGKEHKPNNTSDSGDLCWGSDHVVMSLGGNTTELVKKDGTDEWRPADDDGSRLEHKKGAANGTKDGEYWVLTTTDGTRYHFGLNKLPGAPDGTVTNSALTVPVFGNHPTEPCHATAFMDSDCAQGYRWNLDYVVDPLGDAMTLWWAKWKNYYGQNMKADQQISYDRSAQLDRIDYGLRSDKLFGVQPAGRVAFKTTERCVPTSTFDCAESKRTTANAKHWPDVPLDQACASGAKCTDKYSPTFWTTKRLEKITTQVLSGGALNTVDSWTLEQSYPPTGDGTSPALWLKSITRTGHGADGTAAMPKVTFAGTQMDNRVDGVEGLPPFSRLRIHAIDTESGGRIGVTYSPRECQALEPRKMPAAPESNTMRCFPQYWTPKGERNGDATTTIPPKGDTVTTVFEDAEGRTERLREYTNTERTKWRDTVYEYDDLDDLRKVTAPGGAATSFEYDKRGRQTVVIDPDGGRTKMRYDATDNVVATTDPLERTLVTTYDEGGRPTTLREDSETGPKRVEWTYDTLAKGLPTAAIRYDGGREYREEVTEYDKAYRVKSSKTVIPEAEIGVAGTYTYRYDYTPTGNLFWAEVPGMGGLVTEKVVFRYNSDDLPIAIGGASTYLADVEYSAFGEILRTDAGPAAKRVHGTYTYDEFTRRLQTATFDRSLAPARISETRYGYDQAGNVTKITDVPGTAAGDAGGRDTQCFVYDQLRQMTSAWSAKADDCAAGPSKSTVGGPEAYWQSYTYDEAGNRKELVEHDPTGDTAKDVKRTYTYGKPGVGGPNALAEIKSAGPQGERLNTFSYDKAGNTTKRQHGGTQQSLEWDVEGQLRKVTEPVEGGGTKTTSYLYGADGERLIRTGADGSRTLYLGEAELTVSADNMTAKAERFYAHPDGMTTVRATGGIRELMISDHHGTSHTVVDMVDPAMGVTRRKSMPFGEARGQQPTDWPGQRGFVGGTVDPDTGLTRLGARDYDPVTGRFISVDPMVDYGQPATMNPYAYSNNAPATFSDPTGEFFPILIGIAARIAIQAAIRAAARRAAIIAARKAAQAAARRAAALARKRALEAAKRAAAKARREAARKAAAAKRAAAKRAAARAAAKRAAARRAAAQARARAARAAARKAAARRAAARKAAARPKPRAKPRSQPKARPKPSQVKRAVKKVAREVRDEAKETAKDEAQNIGCESANSFVPGTRVLMADGSTKPIEKVKVGDKVIATDPKTGRTSVQTATATILGKGTKRLVKVTLSIHDGASSSKSGTKTTTVTATAGHPFWVPSLREWIDAGELKPGQWLQTSSGTWVQVGAVEAWTAAGATVHNLTVTDAHTFYVLAGTSAVLAHNCDLSARAGEIHAAEPDAFIRKNVSTVAVVRANTPRGQVNVVAGSGDGLTPAQMSAIRRGEIVADNVPGTHAEQNALLFINRMGWTPVAGGTSRNVCRGICAPLIRGTGGRMMGTVYPGNGNTTTRQRSFEW